GDAVHEHDEQSGGGGEPGEPGGADVEVGAAQRRGDDDHDDLQQAQAEHHHQVPRDQQRAGDGGGEQFALGAAVAVDDHAQPGERGGQRHEQADRADGDERRVVDAGVQAAERGLERRGDDQREQDRREHRHGDLAGVVGGQGGTARG